MNTSRIVVNTPSYTSRAFIYLSLGRIPIRFLLAKQRLLFLHYIFKEEETSLTYNVLNATLEDPTKKNFGNQVKKDPEDLNIKLSIEKIKSMTKYSFKKLVKTLKSSIYTFRKGKEQSRKDSLFRNTRVSFTRIFDF